MTRRALDPPLRHTPFAHGRYDVTSGLKPLGQGPIFEIDAHYPALLAEKLVSRAASHNPVYVQEGFTLVLRRAHAHAGFAALARDYPLDFALEGEVFTNRVTGLAWHLDWEAAIVRTVEAAGPGAEPGLQAAFLALGLAGLDAFDALALNVPEDLAVLHQPAAVPEGDRLVAIHLSFPNHWAPEDKIGKAFGAVHAPVAGIAPLVRAAPSILQVAIAKPPFERFAWGLATDTRLDHHPAHPLEHESRKLAITTPEAAGAGMWVRIERQTLVGDPATASALFTIKTSFLAVSALAAEPAHAAALARAVAGMSPEQRAYKGLTDTAAPLIAYLEAASAAPAR